MSALTIELPESLYRQVAELARADGISVEQFIATATAEKIAVLMSTDFLRRETALGSRADFERALKKVPDVPAEPYDELPKPNHENTSKRPTKRQLEYLAFIHKYIHRFGRAPAESDIERHFLVSAPSVNQMVQMLERRGFITRQPGVPRSIRLRIDLTVRSKLGVA